MKTLIASALALGLIAGSANAKTVFESLNEIAPRADVFGTLADSAPRSVFDDIRDSAPRADIFGQLNQQAPRSDGVFGKLRDLAP